MTGNVRSGVTVTVSASSNVDIRVMQPSRGLPLISIEQEPHLPALQFHRHGEVRRLGGLEPVDDVEHDLALVDLDLEVLRARRRCRRRARPGSGAWCPSVRLRAGERVDFASSSSVMYFASSAAVEQAEQLRPHRRQRLVLQPDVRRRRASRPG